MSEDSRNTQMFESPTRRFCGSGQTPEFLSLLMRLGFMPVGGAVPRMAGPCCRRPAHRPLGKCEARS